MRSSNFRWDWLVGSIALALLVMLTIVVVAGFRAESADHRHLRLSRYSDYVRSQYALRVPDDPSQLNTIATVLDLAGRSQDAGTLIGFYQRCSIERLLGTDDACRRATVRSATSVPIPDEDPASASVGSEPERLIRALSFSVVDASDVSGLVDDRDGFLAAHHYLGESLWSDDEGNGQGGYVILGVRNGGLRTVASVYTEFRPLTGNPARSARIHCGTDLSPFRLPEIPPGGTGKLVCPFGRDIGTQDMGAFLQAARGGIGNFVRVDTLGLKDPPVTLTDRGANYKPRFAVTRVVLPVPESTSAAERQIRALPCQVTGTCPSWAEPFLLQAFAMLNQAGRPFFGALVGALMGLMVGGFAKGIGRSLLIGLGIVLLVVILLALLLSAGGSGSSGFFLLGMVKLASVLLEFGFAWAAAFGVGCALMQLLKRRMADVRAGSAQANGE